MLLLEEHTQEIPGLLPVPSIQACSLTSLGQTPRRLAQSYTHMKWIHAETMDCEQAILVTGGDESAYRSA